MKIVMGYCDNIFQKEQTLKKFLKQMLMKLS